MSGRQYQSSSAYRYGFNGKEKDNEVKGEGNSYDFGARIYDPRLGRWLGCDPLIVKYPELSPYNFCANNPILFLDNDGKEIIISFKDQNNQPQTIVYTAGMTAKTGNTFVDDAITTLNTLHNGSETARGIIDKAISAKQTVNVKYSSNDDAGYDTKVSKNGTYPLDWNPAIGDIMPNANPVTGETAQAAGITLSHELNHFINHAKLLQDVEDSKVTGGVNYESSDLYKKAQKALHDYEYTPESDENTSVVPNETKVANDFKMGTRNSYDDIPKRIDTKGAMSTEKDSKKEYKGKLDKENKKGAGSKPLF